VPCISKYPRDQWCRHHCRTQRYCATPQLPSISLIPPLSVSICGRLTCRPSVAPPGQRARVACRTRGLCGGLPSSTHIAIACHAGCSIKATRLWIPIDLRRVWIPNQCPKTWISAVLYALHQDFRLEMATEPRKALRCACHQSWQ
jgi:hypothetical protein